MGACIHVDEGAVVEIGALQQQFVETAVGFGEDGKHILFDQPREEPVRVPLFAVLIPAAQIGHDGVEGWHR